MQAVRCKLSSYASLHPFDVHRKRGKGPCAYHHTSRMINVFDLFILNLYSRNDDMASVLVHTTNEKDLELILTPSS